MALLSRLQAAAVLTVLALDAGTVAASDFIVIDIQDSTFKPAVYTVPLGTTVEWVNRDSIPHTVALADQFESPVLANGDSFTWTFREAGQFAYGCTLHKGMNGVLTVSNR